ncbi:MAG: hypothetical protein M1817_002648 [Caeruleum heppii]|nr:MAG: hypothetical protein M1817_002648 [Caeruleum heppii]
MTPRINIPPFTRAVLVSLVALSTLTGAIRYRQWMNTRSQNGSTPNNEKIPDPAAAYPDDPLIPYLTLVPQLALFYPWVFLTTTLVEQNIFTLAITGVTIFYGGRYLERAWSSAEFAKFILVVALIPNLLSFGVYIMWFALTGDMTHSITTICGGVALQAGFLVAFKQLVPEHTVAIARGLVKIRVKHFPSLFLLCNIISGIIFGTDTAAYLSLFGFVASWTYLRFYKVSFPDLTSSQPMSLRGDASETFAFAQFFPDPLQTPIAAVADVIYQALVSIKVCTPFSAADVDAGNSQAAARGEGGLPGLLGRGGGPAPGSARAEAERRRALALKALDQRLHAATNRGNPAASAPPPSLAAAPVQATDGHDAQEERGQDGQVARQES